MVFTFTSHGNNNAKLYEQFSDEELVRLDKTAYINL